MLFARWTTLGGYASPVLVESHMGRPTKMEGNPDHPISQGKLCTRGQAAAEITYHPDRVGHPLKRTGARGEGKFEEISWDQALGELVSKFDALAAAVKTQ